MHVPDAKVRRIGFPPPATLPGFAGGDKLVARHIQDVKANAEGGALELIQLRVHQLPAAVVPHLTDPVVLVVAGQKVTGKATAGPGRHA